MADKQVAKPLADFDNVFNEVADMCRVEDPSFDQPAIQAWGSADKPLFNIKELEKSLNKKNIRQVIYNDAKKDDPIFEPGVDYVKQYALYNGKCSTMVFLTTRGLHNYLVVSRGKIPGVYRKFLYVIVERIVNKGVVTKEEAFDDLRKSFDDAEKRSRRLENRVLALKDRNSTLIQAKNTMKMHSDRKDMMLVMKKNQIEELQGMCDDIYDSEPFGDKSYLDAMIEQFMKKIYIHTFNPEKPSKAKKKMPKLAKKRMLPLEDEYELGLTDSEDEELEIEPISFDDITDKYSVSYYRLSMKELRDGVCVGHVHIGGAKHKKALYEYLDRHGKTAWTDVYKISIDELQQKARKSFIRLNNL